MKAVLYNGVKQIEIREISDETPLETEWIKVKVKASGLCGSDIHKLLYEQPISNYLKTRILGHEITGVVTECGSNVTKFGIGDRVVVEPIIPCKSCGQCKKGNQHLCSNIKGIGRDIAGGFAEYVRVPQSQLHHLPSEISFAEGTLIDAIAVGVHCIHKLKPNLSTWTVAIIGDGPLGLICLQLAKIYGAEQTIIFGKHFHNLAIASKLGASKTILSADSDNIIKFKDSFDVVIETVGGRQSDTLALCIKLVSPASKIGILGVYDFNYYAGMPLREAFYKEAQIIGLNSYAVWNGEREFETAIRLLEDGSINVKPLITLLPLASFQEGLNLIQNKQTTKVVKVIFKP